MRIARRAFLAGVTAATAGLALGVARRARADAATPGPGPSPGSGPAPRVALVPLIQLGTDGSIAIICHRSEMGQGVRSTLPVLIADELGADPDQIEVVQGDGDPAYGDQSTDGSTSVRAHLDELRRAGAAAREMLALAAARRWRVPAARLVVARAAVRDPRTGRSAPFGDLVLDARALPVPRSPRLRPLRELAHVGRDLPFRDAPAYVTGAAIYGADVHLPGMRVAVIARPPANLGAVARLDDAAARRVPGVRQIVTLPAPRPPLGAQPLGGVAVIADHTWAALRGRAALDVTWEPGPHGAYDSAAYEQALLAAVRAPGEVARKVGDAEAALAAAAARVEAEYVVPHLIHAPMEPPVALARVEGDRCEVWACTQDPMEAAGAVAAALDLPRDHVTVHVTMLGGGFGRKSIPDYAVEAALLAREAGAPVRVQWTRDDELRHGYYHAHSAQHLTAGLDAAGEVVAWRHRVAYPSIASTFAPGVVRPSAGELGQGLLDLPLAVPNVSIETGAAPAHVRIGWMRSVCNVQQAFAAQSFIAELAHATRRDPRDMLLRVLGAPRRLDAAALGVAKVPNYGASLDEHPIDVGRLHRVLERVTAAAGWDRRGAGGARALGLAVHRSFLSYVGVVVAVVPRGAGVHVDEAWVVGDCGYVVNPERVRAQLEGAVLFAMSATLRGAITWKDGAVAQRSFRDYPLVRLPEAPRAIHVELVASDAPPGGVGEAGVPPVAPAIANAAFALTGVRTRRLPFSPPPA